jgi:hypothetical protein
VQQGIRVGTHHGARGMRQEFIVIRPFTLYATAMTKKLSWNEILGTYHNEWVELVDYVWDLSDPNPSEGVVKAHSADRKEFNLLLLQNPAADSAVLFAGKVNLPENSYLHANLRVAQK